MSGTRKRLTAPGLVADLKAAREAQPLSPPPGLTQIEREHFDAILEARLGHEWRRLDLPLIKAYLRAWSDAEAIQKRIDQSDYVLGTKLNPLMLALHYTFQRITLLMRALAIAAPKARTPTERAVTEEHRRHVRRALSATTDDDDDGLLAH